MSLIENSVVYDQNFWFEQLINSKEITISGELVPMFLKNINDFEKLKNILNNLNFKSLTLILNNKFSESEKYFFSESQNEKFVDLNNYLNQNVDNLYKQIAEIIKISTKITVKILPFALDNNILKIDNQIFLSFKNFNIETKISTILISEDDKNLYQYFNNLLDNIYKNELAQTIVLNQDNNLVLPEYLQIIDNKGNLLTKLARKFVEKHNREKYKSNGFDFAHRHIYCFVVSKNNKILVQKRAENKDNPNLWDKSVGGHVDFEETTVQACIRELQEELGIHFNPLKHRLSVLFSQIKPTAHERIVNNPIQNIYECSANEMFLLSNVDENEIVIDNYEVKGYKWLLFDELKQLSKTELVTYDLKILVEELEL